MRANLRSSRGYSAKRPKYLIVQDSFRQSPLSVCPASSSSSNPRVFRRACLCFIRSSSRGSPINAIMASMVLHRRQIVDKRPRIVATGLAIFNHGPYALFHFLARPAIVDDSSCLRCGHEGRIFGPIHRIHARPTARPSDGRLVRRPHGCVPLTRRGPVALVIALVILVAAARSGSSAK